MKSLQQIKDEYASENNLERWDYDDPDEALYEICELYAQECVREAAKLVAEAHRIIYEERVPGTKHERLAEIEQQLKQLKGEI